MWWFGITTDLNDFWGFHGHRQNLPPNKRKSTKLTLRKHTKAERKERIGIKMAMFFKGYVQCLPIYSKLFEQMHSCLTKKNCTDWMFQKLSFPQSICRILSATLQATWYQGTQKDWNLNFKPHGHSNYMAFNSQSRLRVWYQDKNLESWNRKYIAVALSNVQVVYN